MSIAVKIPRWSDMKLCVWSAYIQKSCHHLPDVWCRLCRKSNKRVPSNVRIKSSTFFFSSDIFDFEKYHICRISNENIFYVSFSMISRQMYSISVYFSLNVILFDPPYVISLFLYVPSILLYLPAQRLPTCWKAKKIYSSANTQQGNES